MSALTAARVVLVARGTIKKFTGLLAAGQSCQEGSVLCRDTSAAGALKVAVAGSTTLIPVGFSLSAVNNSAGGSAVAVACELFTERDIWYYDSVTGSGAVTSGNLYEELYLASDHEVTTTTSGNSQAGVMWTISPSGSPGAIGVVAPYP